LSSRAGSSAFHTASAALSNTWDGDVDSFPPFVIALKLRAREMHWTAAPPTGVSTIANHNLFDDYYSITNAEAELARLARTNDRAMQNSRAMYKCLQRSITGDLFTIIFEQAANIPHEDGPLLFLMLTSYTVSSSVQLSMNAIQRLMAFDPAKFKYEIPRINTTLLHLFVMASSPGRPLAEPERIQYILTTYVKIRQPESWASWVRTQTERVEDGIPPLITSQTLLNKAVLKYNKIRSTESTFTGSTSSIQEDIVAMFAKKAPASNKTSKNPTRTLISPMMIRRSSPTMLTRINLLSSNTTRLLPNLMPPNLNLVTRKIGKAPPIIFVIAPFIAAASNGIRTSLMTVKLALAGSRIKKEALLPLLPQLRMSPIQIPTMLLLPPTMPRLFLLQS